MRFQHFIKCNLSNRTEFDTLPYNILDIIHENVIFVDSKSYIDIVKKFNNIKRFMKSLDDILLFLNNELNPMNISFITGNNNTKPIIDAYTNKHGNITIVVSNELFYHKMFNDFKWFLDHFKRILDHELIHRVQRVDFSKMKPIHQDTIDKYLSNKHEIMAYAKNIINDLIDKHITPEKVLSLIQQPSINLNNDLKRYFINFHMNSNTIKQLYKYMYQYLIQWK